MENYRDESIQAAYALYQELLLKGEVRKARKSELYKLYYDTNVRDIIHNIFLPQAGANVVANEGVLYLIPNVDNIELSYSNKELREIMKLKNNKELYLARFMQIIAFSEFYGPQFHLTGEPRSFIEVRELLASVRNFIKVFDSEDEEILKELADEYEFNIIDLIEAWHSLAEVTEDVKDERRATKRNTGFLLKVLRFWEEEGLITVENNEEIYLTNKMKTIAHYYNQNERIAKIQELLEGTNKNFVEDVLDA